MRVKTLTWSELGLTLISVLVVLWSIGCVKPCAAQEGDEAELQALLDLLTPADLAALIEQSEADSLRIEELEIQLFWARERQRIAENEKPNWIERFMARYGFAVGAAAGVYVGAAAAR